MKYRQIHVPDSALPTQSPITAEGWMFWTCLCPKARASLRPLEREAKKNRAVGCPTARLCGLGLFYRVLVSAPSMDGWLPLWNRAKNALIAEPTVYVLVYPVKVTRRGEPGTEVISV